MLSWSSHNSRLNFYQKGLSPCLSFQSKPGGDMLSSSSSSSRYLSSSSSFLSHYRLLSPFSFISSSSSSSLSSSSSSSSSSFNSTRSINFRRYSIKRGIFVNHRISRCRRPSIARSFCSKKQSLPTSIGSYVEAIYEKWLENPRSVDNSWANYFQSGEMVSPVKSSSSASLSASSSSMKSQHSEEGGGSRKMSESKAIHSDASMAQDTSAVQDVANMMKLIRSYQTYGHFRANLDPLGILDQGIDRKHFKGELLDAEYWGFGGSNIDRKIQVGDHPQFTSLLGNTNGWVTPRMVIERLREVYCNSVGFQYTHISNSEKTSYLRTSIEKEKYEFTKEEKIRILDRLMWATEFEKFLDLKYPAQRRFGIVGGEAYVPLIKEVIDEGARLGINNFVIGMPHRGRLITLCSVMRKPLERILHEFRGLALPWDQVGDSGDVKYHLGYSADRNTPDEIKVHLSLVPNPSHLEAVNPVCMGKTRAKQYFTGDMDRKKTCCILVHGDAAFAGQGSVYESMSLTELPDYTTGGVIHLVVNNQIGFTTDPAAARSSPYCTDAARAIAAPIFHVNGDDVEAVVKCAKMSVRYRQTFKTDAVVDLVCFRRYGHNEGDDPSFTQPYMYRVINDKMKRNDTVLEKYKKQLIEEEVITEKEAKQMEERILQNLTDAYEKSANYKDDSPDWLGHNWHGMLGPKVEGSESNTAITEESVRKIAATLTTIPKDFHAHRTLKKILEKRKHSIEEGKDIDWGTGEALAFGSLLLEGYHVRVSGQDCERGTFAHRHAVMHEQENVDAQHAPTYVPLSHIPGATGKFHICNSNLSELGVLGFEYGYSTEHPDALVIWEAQYGDFANGAQVIFDQFISSAEKKWLKSSGLVCLLPHGYEAGGPEHSSGRIERFLQSCNDDPDELILNNVKQLQYINWQVVNCTTPANFFHVLRRQMHRDFRKPLIVFTPKFGLRHPLARSQLKDFCGSTKFQRVIPDNGNGLVDGMVKDNEIRRVIFCSGKLWIHLMERRVKSTQKDQNRLRDVAFVRVEQLAPFPYDLIQQQIRKYPNAELVWAQEEPKNMGAWPYMAPRFMTALQGAPNKVVRLVARKCSAAPATGYPQIDKKEEEEVVNACFT